MLRREVSSIESRVHPSVVRRLVGAAGGTICARRRMLLAGIFLSGLALIVAAGIWRPAPIPAQIPTGTPTYDVNAKWVTDKGSQVYNVKAYGATGNGTTDDTAAINATIAAAGVGGMILFPAGNYLVSSQLQLTTAHQVLWGYGANIICNLSSAADCIYIGTTAGPSYSYPGISIRGFQFTPGTNTSANSAIGDNGVDATFKDIHTGSSSGHSFLHIITDYDDQDMTIDRLYDVWWGLTCNSTSCGSAVYGASGTSNAGIAYIRNSDLTMQCSGNPIDWWGGHFTVSNTILQSWSQFAVRAAAPADVNGWTHWEQGACTNPLNDGNGHALGGAGLIVLGGTAAAEGSAPGGVNGTVFSTNATGGSTSYWYYVVGHTSGGGVTAPLLAGYLNTGASTISSSAEVFTVWPALTNSNVTTFDLLRLSAGTLPNAGSSGSWAVATGLSASSICGGNGVCAYTDSAGSPSSYTVATETWYPVDTFWPGNLVVFAGGTPGGNSYLVGTYSGYAVGSMVVDSAPSDSERIHIAYSAGGETTYAGSPYPYGPVKICWTGAWFVGSGLASCLYSPDPYGQSLHTSQPLYGTFNGSLTGNASTASALAATPTGCSAPYVASGIAANGNANCVIASGAPATLGGWIGAEFSGQGASNARTVGWFSNSVVSYTWWPMPFSASIGTWGATSTVVYAGATLIGLAESLGSSTNVYSTPPLAMTNVSANGQAFTDSNLPTKYVPTGDLIAPYYMGSGSHASMVTAQILGSASQPLGGNLAGATIAVGTVYSGFSTSATPNATETNVEIPIALGNGGTIQNFCFVLSSANSSSASLTATVRHGVGSSGAMANTSLTVTAGNSYAAGVPYCDYNPSHAFTVANGDRVTVSWTGSGATSGGVEGYGAQLIPNSPATGMLIAGADGLTFAAGGTDYIGFFTNTGLQGNEYVAEAVAPRTATFPNIQCYVTAAPTGASETVTLRQNGTNPSGGPVATIPTSFSAPGVQASSGSVQITAGQLFDLLFGNSGGSAAAGVSACSAEID